MAKASQASQKIRSWKGLKEGPAVDKVIIDPWNAKTGCHAKSEKNPWCAITAASCYLQIHASGYSLSSTCKGQKAYYKKHDRYIPKGQRPHVGDVIFLTGHEGIVTSTSRNGKAIYYSGNCKNSVLPSSFNWKTGRSGKKSIQGYGRPIWK